MRIFIFGLGMLFSVSLRAQSVEVLKPEEYSVERFQEVVNAYLETGSESPQERLISLRANLAIAERQLDTLKKKREEAVNPKLREDAPKVVHIRAAQARVDHYKKKIEDLEREILKSQRSDAKSKSSSKKKVK